MYAQHRVAKGNRKNKSALDASRSTSQKRALSVILNSEFVNAAGSIVGGGTGMSNDRTH